MNFLFLVDVKRRQLGGLSHSATIGKQNVSCNSTNLWLHIYIQAEDLCLAKIHASDGIFTEYKCARWSCYLHATV